MTSLIATIETFINHHQLIAPGNTIIIGLSGGPDSVFLTHMLKMMAETHNLTLIATHLNHEWRADAAKDARLCQALCDHLGIPLVATTRTALNFVPHPDPGSQEARGRMLRRYFFEQVRKQYNAQAIALAHHRQDQEETFFIRLIRGTTLDGLTSMKPRDGYYIRPLLATDKRRILSYLEEHTIPFATDPTNLSATYLRNRIRMNVIPALQACDSRFDDNFERTIEHLNDANEFIHRVTKQALLACTSTDNGKSILNLAKFFATDPFLRRPILIAWLRLHRVPFILTQAFIEEILKFLRSAQGGTHTMHHTWQIIKAKGQAHISKKSD